MSGTVHALLVAIDAYLPPVSALYGCRNDQEAWRADLMARLGDRLRLTTLVDGAATRQGVIDGFRSAFAPAGPGDVALFVYSGHGSEEPAAPEVVKLEPSGRIQTLVCADSGRRVGGKLVRPLADKELAVLISEVAARGAHVVVILDCCHSGDATRDPRVRVRRWEPDPAVTDPTLRELVAELATPRPADEFLPGALGAPRPDHVALSACTSAQVAKELAVDGHQRGAFTVGLLGALGQLGSGTTYRDLLLLTRSRVERAVAEQEPVLAPVVPGGPADGLVFDGALRRVDASFHVTRGADACFLDGGAIHGFAAPEQGESFELTCTDPVSGAAAGRVRVVDVGAARSTVEPIGWVPADTVYPAVVTSVPLPPASLTFDDGTPSEVADRVRAALAAAGPDTGPSPFVVEGATAGLVLRVSVAAGNLRLARADGTTLTGDVTGTDASAARRLVARMEHVTRWEQLRRLGDHPSPLTGLVRLAVFMAEPGETARPADRAALTAVGAYDLVYRRAGDQFVAPAMFLELTNTAGRDLSVALVDLTDRFACRTALFPTARIAAGQTVSVWGGAPIPASLPAGRAVVPGASARDWLKLVVSEADFDASVFELSALDDPPRSASAAPVGRSTLERLATRAITRDIGAPPATPVDQVAAWAAETIAVSTQVPST